MNWLAKYIKEVIQEPEQELDALLNVMLAGVCVAIIVVALGNVINWLVRG